LKSLLSDKNLRIFFAAWWLLCLAIQFFVLKQLNIDDTHAAIDSLCSIILLSGGSLFISNNLKYYLPRKERYWYIVIVSVTVGFFWILAQRGAMWALLKSDDVYNQFVSETAWIRFGAGFLLLSSMSMFSMMWYVQQEYTEMLNRKAETEQLSKEAELFKLRSQFQPHFLFNSLNSTSALIGSDPGKARNMIYQLSDFLRGTLKKEEHQWIALEEEIEYLHLYLEIEKVRFGHRLKTQIDVPEDSLRLQLPALILQPVVENAIKYGLYDTIGEVLIRIEAEAKSGNLLIKIENPFDPETMHSSKGTGFGLRSIRRRLFLLFARSDLLKTSSNGHLFVTSILIPQTLQPQSKIVNEKERK
jgi:hypothetical protein